MWNDKMRNLEFYDILNILINHKLISKFQVKSFWPLHAANSPRRWKRMKKWTVKPNGPLPYVKSKTTLALCFAAILPSPALANRHQFDDLLVSGRAFTNPKVPKKCFCRSFRLDRCRQHHHLVRKM
jgi:hypothetical protein